MLQLVMIDMISHDSKTENTPDSFIIIISIIVVADYLREATFVVPKRFELPICLPLCLSRILEDTPLTG